MPEKSCFFDSTAEDPREYTADEFAEYFRRVLTDGIFNGGTNLQVTADGTNMNVNIADGYAWIQGYMYKVYGAHTLTLDTADPTYDRIDRVVLRLDKSLEKRSIEAVVLKGTPSATPTPPALTRNDNVYELSLAQVRVIAGKSFIEGFQITDERLNTQVCGLVNSLIQADTTEIFNQFQAWYNSKTAEFQQDWNDWFSAATNTFGSEWTTWFNQTQQEWDTYFQTVQNEGYETPSGAQAKVDAAIATHSADNVSHVPYAVATGTANTYAVTLNPAPTAYADGMAISIKINVDSTGASTLNVNGLGAKPLKKANGKDATNLKANGVYTFRYNASTGNFILQGEGGSGDAQPSDVLSGKTFTNDSGEQTGTMPNRGAYNITPGTRNVTIPAGYHNGMGVVYGDPDLISANIKQGVNIFGVSGTLKPAPDLSNPVYDQTRSTHTSVSIGSGTTGSPSSVALSITNAFSVCEMTYMDFSLQVNGRSTGTSGYNARAQIQIRFRATGYTITVADLYASGLIAWGNKQAKFSSLLLIASSGQCHVQLGGISGSNGYEIPSGMQYFSNAGIKPSNGIDLLVYADCDTTDSAFYAYAGVGTGGKIKAY